MSFFSLFFTVFPGKCQGSSLIRPQLLPNKFFPIYHSPIILLFRLLKRKILLLSEVKGTMAMFCKLNLPKILGVALDSVRDETKAR
jgi:hypothetical protein